MKKYIVTILILLISNVNYSQDNAEEIISKLLEVYGGFNAFNGISTRVEKGTVIFNSDSLSFNGTFIRYYKSPNLYSRILITKEGSKYDTIYSGENGKATWTYSRKSGLSEKVLDKHRNPLIPPIYYYKDDYTTYKLTGIKNIGGKDAYEILLTDKDNAERLWYIDADKYLLIKSARKTNENNVERYREFMLKV